MYRFGKLFSLFFQTSFLNTTANIQFFIGKLVSNKRIEFLFQDNPDSIASDTESQSNVVDANVNMTYAISSADSNVNVTILNNSESESSKFASSDVQNTASVAEHKTRLTAADDGDQSVASADAGTTSDTSSAAGTDVEPRPRVSATGSPVR